LLRLICFQELPIYVQQSSITAWIIAALNIKPPPLLEIKISITIATLLTSMAKGSCWIIAQDGRSLCWTLICSPEHGRNFTRTRQYVAPKAKILIESVLMIFGVEHVLHVSDFQDVPARNVLIEHPRLPEHASHVDDI
jgi:hypothetical protein